MRSHKPSPMRSYMIGTASIDCVYQRQHAAHLLKNQSALCSCSSGGPKDRTVSCPMHNKSQGFRGKAIDLGASLEPEPDPRQWQQHAQAYIQKGMYQQVPPNSKT